MLANLYMYVLTLAANLLRWNLACCMLLVSPRQDFARCQNRDSRPLKSFNMTVNAYVSGLRKFA